MFWSGFESRRNELTNELDTFYHVMQRCKKMVRDGESLLQAPWGINFWYELSAETCLIIDYCFGDMAVKGYFFWFSFFLETPTVLAQWGFHGPWVWSGGLLVVLLSSISKEYRDIVCNTANRKWPLIRIINDASCTRQSCFVGVFLVVRTLQETKRTQSAVLLTLEILSRQRATAGLPEEIS